jgi:hypothetical protein
MGSILRLADRDLAVDGELNFERRAGRAKADEELFAWAAESVVHMGYAA